MARNLLDFLVQNAADRVPLPEQIIFSIRETDNVDATMAHVDLPDGKRLYCVRDWVYWVSASQSSGKTPAWANLKRAINKDIAKDIEAGKADEKLTLKGLLNLQYLEIQTPGGVQKMDFTDEEGLYQITQRMSDRSSTVRAVKTYLAQAGVFMGEAYNNPAGAADELDNVAYNRELKKLLAQGFTLDEAQEWLEVRRKQKHTRRFITAIWSVRGVNSRRDFADLTNHVHRVTLGLTATRHKRQLEIKDTPRNHISAADNATIQITEFTSGLMHEHKESFGTQELAEDIDDVRPIIDSARAEIQKAFSQKPRRLPGEQPRKLLP